MPKFIRILLAPVVFPYFLIATLFECLSPKSDPDPDADFLIELSEKNRKIWYKLSSAERERFREAIAFAEKTKKYIQSKD
jgi:hypothetical protein